MREKLSRLSVRWPRRMAEVLILFVFVLPMLALAYGVDVAASPSTGRAANVARQVQSDTATPTNTPPPVIPSDTATPTNTPPPVMPTDTATPTNTPTSSACPGAPANLRTDIIGKGMGSNNSRIAVVKVLVPNNGNVVSLYGQFAGKEQNSYRYPRFIRPNGTFINDQTKESPAYQKYAIFWYGQALTPATLPHWRLRLIGAATSAPFVERAFILYPTYQTAESYVNLFETFPVSADNHVYWDTANGWFPTQQETIVLPAPLRPVDVVVSVAVVDNDKGDGRPFELTISAGSVSQFVSRVNPANGSQLDIVTVTLEDVPVGTNAIVLDLESPHLTGDSVAMVGMTAHYNCAATIP